MALVTQGQQANALPSTVFYSSGTLTTDLSQYDTDLTASGSQAYEDPSARTALFSERSITLSVEMDTSSSGTIVYRGNNALAPLFEVSVSGSSVTIEDDNELSMSATVPGLGASDSTVHILAATKADPIGGTYYTELTVYNETTDDDPVTERSTHGADTPDAADHFAIGGRWNGAAMSNTYSDTINAVRIDEAYLPPHMLREWVSASSPAAYTAKEECGRRPMPIDQAKLEELEQFAGPALDLGAWAHKGHGLRLLGPLVNRVHDDVQTIDPNDYDASFDNAWHTGYGTNRTVCIPYIDYAELPLIGNRAQVRIHAKVFNALGAASDLEVRCYSSNRKPGLSGWVNPNDVPPLERYYVTETISDHGTGNGEMVTFTNLLKIARDASGGTWLFLTFNHGAGSPGVNDRFEIAAWSVELVSVEVADGGIGDAIDG